MYDSGKILIGLVVFIGIVAFPFLYNIGTAVGKPEPRLDTPAILEMGDKKQCVESKEFMRAEHMRLLNEWRDAAVRDGNRLYTGKNGMKFDISLQNTCMKCHSNKQEFCDRCHTYVDVKPYCWDCHVAPKENGL
ncbi:MAG: sulfate reduction electron transfer complex DsrMKJOP subunit DsrJ [Nitrospirales bacterium]|nr:sulfate reduction electron transfer complex DsrMKJOP subunit DsrJ [Nitrospirales bacterium]